MKTTAIILSAGKGTRLGADIPKQYIEICGKPVLAYTLMAFQNSSVDEIIIVAADEYAERCRKISENCGCTKLCQITEGGKERYDSVLNGIRCAVKRNTGEADQKTLVLIHDGARPFIRPETIDLLISTASECGAAIAASPCTDTIKLIDEKGNIVSTTDRKLTWAAQTPQVFYADMIASAYEKIIGGENQEGRNITITDDAMVYQLAYPDRKVKVIDAGRDNIKITTATDLKLSENIIKNMLTK